MQLQLEPAAVAYALGLAMNNALDELGGVLGGVLGLTIWSGQRSLVAGRASAGGVGASAGGGWVGASSPAAPVSTSAWLIERMRALKGEV